MSEAPRPLDKGNSVSLKRTVRIGAAGVALSAAALAVAAGPALASPFGAVSVPVSHHHKGTDQLDEDGPSYNEPAEPKDAGEGDEDVTPGGVPVHGSADSVQDAPNKVLPSGADHFIPPSSTGSLVGGGF